jgi:hypothetical protein
MEIWTYDLSNIIAVHSQHLPIAYDKTSFIQLLIQKQISRKFKNDQMKSGRPKYR